MGTLKTNTIEPATGSTLTLGASGDTITVSSDSIKVNTYKDAGGNTLFTSDGAGTLSSVNSAFVGTGPVLISTSTASGVSSVVISSGITSTYDEYMFVLTNVNLSVNSEDLNLNFSLTGSFSSLNMTTTMVIQRHDEDGSDGQWGYQTNADQANGTSQKFADSSQLSNAADANFGSILHLFSPSSTTFAKHFYLRTIAKSKVPGVSAAMVSGYINNTGAVTQVSFAPSSGTFDGVIQMYGIK